MKRIFLRLKQPLRNERGEITFFACFFVVGIVMLISFLLLYASIRITCINIRNGAKMELNNLSGTIYADTYRSQRETNFEEYLNTLYSSSDYTDMLEATVAGGLDSKIPLSTEDYKVSNISLEFNVEDGRVEYIFYCDVEFYVRMFGHSYPAIPWISFPPMPLFKLFLTHIPLKLPDCLYRFFIASQILLHSCCIFLADPVGFGIPVSALPVQSVQFGLTPFLGQAVISNKLPLFFVQIHFVGWAIPVYAKILWEKESHLQYPILRDASQVNIILTNLLNISVGDFFFSWQV